MNRRLLLIPILFIFIIGAACSIQLDLGEATPVPTGLPGQQSWYSLYFTDPAKAGESGGPDEALAAAIRQASQSVDVAVYNLSLASIQEALINAHQRGLRVRVVMESDNLDGRVPQALQAEGIEMLGDRREGLMHNKFVVIDGSQVWTGSMNLTTTGTYQDNNNLIQIRAPQITQDYQVEFDEMMVDDRFGPGSPANTPHPSVDVEGVRVEVYFSPDDGIQDRLVALLEGAESSIYFLSYTFTANPLADAILERAAAGVRVGGVIEDSRTGDQGSEFNRFRRAGLEVLKDGNPGLMHHKVMILDGQVVILGSYNFTASAEDRNDENLLVIHSPTLAGQFMEEYLRVRARAD